MSPKCEVRKSTICAKGVFAKEPVKKGEIVRITGGIVIPKSDVGHYNELIVYDVEDIYLDVSDDFVMAPTQEDLDQTATINHLCEPNVGFLDTITLIAIRDIEPGEEIGWDYAFSQTTFDPFECLCKKAACRKTIKPDDWQIKSIQEKYGRYYAPYLKAKIEA
ncbi:MAG TPA: SET domain-containing protein-lysine N-methyltransferase [Verrucomicrobiae bacterium]|nr:SET domain-containing protein-lysine N-methyltransferase [Verrucomicrobiae bacterium]